LAFSFGVVKGAALPRVLARAFLLAILQQPTERFKLFLSVFYTVLLYRQSGSPENAVLKRLLAKTPE
jgi:hypothetical protein